MVRAPWRGWYRVDTSGLLRSSLPLMNTPVPFAPRFLSVDALRGFDMFWILGADALVQALAGMTQNAPVAFVAGQLEHKDWAGFAFYDLIFPLFVFIVGVSLVFSLSGLVSREGPSAAVGRLFRRVVLLFLLGIFYNGGLANSWPDVRLAGVLQRMALTYGAAGLLFIYFRPRTLAIVVAILLAGYWALLTFVPIRDFRLDHATLSARLGTAKPTMTAVRAAFDATSARITGGYEPGLNLTNHLDFQFLPGSMYDHYYDPEGYLSTLPAIATCLLGVFAGRLLQRTDLGGSKKVLWLLGAGSLALAAGWAWHQQFPVVKKLWTSSFVLVAGGWSAVLLGCFYYLVDVRQWRGWCQPFVWIGINPITLYLLSSVLNFGEVASRLVGGSVAAWLNTHVGAGAGGFVNALVGLGLVFLLAGFLHHRKVFIRV